MAGPRLTYNLENAGWATAVFNDGEQITITVSYLHDSLKDLAQSVLDLEAGKASTVLFMDEPGETLLELEPRGDSLNYILKWFDDWASWDIVSPDRFRVVAEGSMFFSHYKDQVMAILSSVYENVGMSRYKKLWIEHDFPLDEFRALGGPTWSARQSTDGHPIRPR